MLTIKDKRWILYHSMLLTSLRGGSLWWMLGVVKISVEELRASVECLPWSFSLLASYVQAHTKTNTGTDKYLTFSCSNLRNTRRRCVQRIGRRCEGYRESHGGGVKSPDERGHLERSSKHVVPSSVSITTNSWPNEHGTSPSTTPTELLIVWQEKGKVVPSSNQV